MTKDAHAPAPLVLGTAQLGLAYGIANARGALTMPEAMALVAAARAAGVRDFDTARAYGDSEARLGQALSGARDARIITKLAPLDDLDPNASRDAVQAAVRDSVAQSLTALRRGRLAVLLLHRARHLHAFGGVVWETLIDLKRQGLVQALGVSVQTPDELRIALSFRDVKHIQLPFNVLDWRFRDPALLARLDLRPDVEVHSRSSLLQGLLAVDRAALWPAIDGIDGVAILKALERLSDQCGRMGIADLAFAYVRAHRFIDGVVVGAETAEQITANAALFETAPLTPEQVQRVNATLPHVPESLLNPAKWPRAKAA